ncbi:STAS domain-containing protein [Priestia megaterium]
MVSPRYIRLWLSFDERNVLLCIPPLGASAYVLLIVILPLIGELDTERAQSLIGSTLRCSQTLQLTHLIIDLSGLHNVDATVAQELFYLAETLILLGVKPLLTGIHLNIARTAISLNLNLKNYPVFLNLQSALKSLNYKKDE